MGNRTSLAQVRCVRGVAGEYGKRKQQVGVRGGGGACVGHGDGSDLYAGQVSLTPDADGKGYTASFASPRSFLELPITSGQTLLGDVEVCLSGQGQSGLQTTSRNGFVA